MCFFLFLLTLMWWSCVPWISCNHRFRRHMCLFFFFFFPPEILHYTLNVHLTFIFLLPYFFFFFSNSRNSLKKQLTYIHVNNKSKSKRLQAPLRTVSVRSLFRYRVQVFQLTLSCVSIALHTNVTFLNDLNDILQLSKERTSHVQVALLSSKAIVLSLVSYFFTHMQIHRGPQQQQMTHTHTTLPCFNWWLIFFACAFVLSIFVIRCRFFFFFFFFLFVVIFAATMCVMIVQQMTKSGIFGFIFLFWLFCSFVLLLLPLMKMIFLSVFLFFFRRRRRRRRSRRLCRLSI